ncbi:hypothetical protein [Cohnella soli]|uniref:Intracellular proteinase inhibitor BsuPI domain-containing protein n=1 Tax=Cohnella soli TaxID=425005 RepID=A0ABW0HUM2_9BACL
MDYKVKATFNPPAGKRGERVRLEVEYESAEDIGMLDRSVLRIGSNGIFDVMKQEGDRKFSWTYVIPWEAPIRSYDIEFYALDPKGQKGPVQTVRYQVTG